MRRKQKRVVALLIVGLLVGAPLYVWRFDKWFVKVRMQFSIGIYTANDLYRWTPAGGVVNPVLTADDVTDIEAEVVADPFMLRKDDTWYMFFEAVNARNKRGEIALATSPDGLRWNYREVVLREPFHMSYPYVFEWQGAYYMIPETHMADGIRLYRADDFPTSWSHVGTLLTGRYQDPSILRYDGRWWLFAADVVGNDSLRLFYSEELNGEWKEHPKSPVVRGDATRARPGGRLIVHEDKIVRYAQDDGRFYGRAVRAFIIDKLTPAEYEEHEAPVSPVLEGSPDRFTWWTWNAKGMHHLDAHPAGDGKWIACVDGFYKYHYWSWEALGFKHGG